MPRSISSIHYLPFPVRAWLAGLLFLIPASVVVICLPGRHRRRRLARRTAQGLFRLMGVPVRIHGLERFPEQPCIVVANHASYLDGPVLTAVLPPRFGFVIKREMARVPLAGAFLKRIGSQFVERFDRHRGAADALRVLRTATRGHSLVFFPEGTFTPTPGLMKFHSGAFTTAVRAGCPVVPAVVRGTRTAFSPRAA